MSELNRSTDHESSDPIVWAILFGTLYGLLFGYLSSLFWLIGVPAVFVAVTSIGELIRLFKKMGVSMFRFWLATFLGAILADFLIIMLPLTLVTFTSDLEGSTVESLQVIWKFYLLSLNSIGSNLILTATAGFGLFGFIGIYRRLYVTQKDKSDV